MSERAERINVIDLFAGCGGLSEGLMRSEQINCLAHVEWDIAMVRTLRNRLVKSQKKTEDQALKEVIHFDIQNTSGLLHGSGVIDSRKYSKTNHPDFISGGLEGVVGPQTIDMIVGGPPCQAYSIAGRAQDPNSMRNDYRNFLFESFAAVVAFFKPKCFVFENVPGMLSAAPGGIKVTDRITEAFEQLGYTIQSNQGMQESVFNAADFGVPQARKRVLIFGVKTGEVRFSWQDFISEMNKLRIEPSARKTVEDTIGGYPKIYPKNSSSGQANISHVFPEGNPRQLQAHEPRFHNKRDIGIFRQWVSSGMNSAVLVEKQSFYEKATGKSSGHTKYRNLEWDKPSPTIVAHLKKDGLMFIHPDPQQARSLTVREAASLQSFPEDFEFLESKMKSYEMIGNAVPPLLAESVGRAIVKVLTKCSTPLSST